jgi:hypothetical protein
MEARMAENDAIFGESIDLEKSLSAEETGESNATTEPKDTESPAPVVEGKQEPEPSRPESTESQARIKALEEELGKFKNERLADLRRELDEIKKGAKQQEELPDFNVDPEAYLKMKTEQMEQHLQELRERAEQEEQARARAAEEQNLLAHYRQSAADFSKTNTDFQEAYNYLLDLRGKELELMGITDPQTRAQVVRYEEMQLASMARDQGRNPAEVLYNLSKTRGFTGNVGQIVQPAIERGRQASKGETSSGSGTSEENIESMLELSEEDFDEAWQKLMGS